MTTQYFLGANRGDIISLHLCCRTVRHTIIWGPELQGCVQVHREETELQLLIIRSGFLTVRNHS